MSEIYCECGEDRPEMFYPDKKKGTKKRCITCWLRDSKDPDNKRFGLVREQNDLERKYWR